MYTAGRTNTAEQRALTFWRQ